MITDRCATLRPAELTIHRAAELRASLQAAMRSGSGVVLNLAAVTEMDGAGVQLLLAAKKSARAAGRRLQLAELSPAVLEVFETLDLAAHFAER